MKKQIVAKLFFTLLIITLLPLPFVSTTVNATTIDTSQVEAVAQNRAFDESIITDTNNSEEKIMEYDARTGITREVDMDAVREAIILKNGGRTSSTEAYDPFAKTNPPVIDTRNYIPTTLMSTFPYRVTCRLKYDNYGQGMISSGSLVGPNLLLTAAHCIMNVNDNDAFWADWVAYPGYSNGQSYGNLSSGWAKVYYSSNWKTSHLASDDWALCILYEDLGTQLGWYGCQSYASNSSLNYLDTRTLGYPQNNGNGEQMHSFFGYLKNITAGTFRTSVYIPGGVSGGPVHQNSNNSIVGILTREIATSQESVGTRMRSNIIDLIINNS